MPFTYDTVTIGSTNYTAFQSVAEIDTYAEAAISDAATAWRAADVSTKARAAVTATRVLDRQQWLGEKTDEANEHAFPRTGLTRADGTAVDPDTLPQELLDANSELAMDLVNGATIQTQLQGAAGTKRLKAGSVEIEYFRDIFAVLNPARFPLPVMELIGQWLGGAVSPDGSEATGTCGTTAFDTEYNVNRGF